MLDSAINHVANAFGLELLHFADSFRGLGMKLLAAATPEAIAAAQAAADQKKAPAISILFKGNNFIRLLGGLWVTIRISLIAVLISIPLGILFGMLMTRKNPVTKALSRVYLDFIRIMPQLVLLFIVYFGTTRAFGINLSGELSAVIVFVLWGTAEMGDLVRGALISIPKHQYESAAALGMTPLQTSLYVIIPQTLRRLIPLAINLITRMIKTTSLCVLIGVV